MKLVPKENNRVSNPGLGSNIFDDLSEKVGSALEKGQEGYEKGLDWRKRLYYLRHGELPPEGTEGFQTAGSFMPSNQSGISPWLITGIVAAGAAYGVYKLKPKN